MSRGVQRPPSKIQHPKAFLAVSHNLSLTISETRAAAPPRRMNQLQALIRSHDFSVKSLTIPLSSGKSFEIHWRMCPASSSFLQIEWITPPERTEVMRYAPADNALTLSQPFFNQEPIIRNVFKVMAEELIAMYGKNKYTTTIYTPNPWGNFTEWDDGNTSIATEDLEESSGSFAPAPATSESSGGAAARPKRRPRASKK